MWADYFYRAYALDPVNPIIELSLGLCYIQYSLKRQSDNRQYLILQGFTFIFRYYDKQKMSPHLEERQEAHYNVARTYHMLGITHLALPYYEKVLQEVDGQGPFRGREDIVVDAAYNLQTMYAHVGNLQLSRAITERWLVV
jgi:general transcription factor 3C polypeptide 3 (transcription factor C subunit 4)